MNTKLILASASPRRREILGNLGLKYEIITTNAEEGVDVSELSPEQAVKELAIVKGKAVAQRVADDQENLNVIVSADTVVAHNGKILGKPENRAEAKKMLKMLSGKKHSVYTGICIWFMHPGWCSKGCAVAEKTDVYFKKLSDAMIEAYLDTGEYTDKAGAYGIQGKGAVFVEKIKGDYLNVVGFPLSKFYEILREENKVDLFNMTGGDLWLKKGGLR